MSGASRRILTLYCHDRALVAPPPAGCSSLAALEHSPRGHDLAYHNLADGIPPAGLRSARFDAVILHGSALAWRSAATHAYHRAALDWVADLDCLRLALPADEYDKPGLLEDWLLDLGVHVLFTQVEERWQSLVYPRLHHQAMLVPWQGLHLDADWLGLDPGHRAPAESRPPSLLVRDWPRPFWLGEVGQAERRLLRAARERPRVSLKVILHAVLAHDHAMWLRRLRSATALLGAECGASMPDMRGEFQEAILRRLGEQPDLPYEEARTLLPPQGHGGPLLTTPGLHLAEAVLARTCLVLVEGRYGGLLEAGRHYLPVRADLSDLDERLEQLQDHHIVSRCVESAHADLVDSGRLSLRSLAMQLDEAMDRGLVQSAPKRARHEPPCPPAHESIPPGTAFHGSPLPVDVTGVLSRHADSLLVLSSEPWRGTASSWLPGLAEVAHTMPVFVVVLDNHLVEPREETEPDGVTVLHLPSPARTGHAINALLCRRYAIRPVIVTDTIAFATVVATRYSVATVFIARSGLSLQLKEGVPDEARKRLRRLLARTDLVICFSGSTRRFLRSFGDCTGEVLVVPALPPPGSPPGSPRTSMAEVHRPPRQVLVPGPLDEVLDLPFLRSVMQSMPGWSFRLGFPPPWGDMEAPLLGGAADTEFLGDLAPEHWHWLAPSTAVALVPAREKAPVDAVRAHLLNLMAEGIPVVSSRAAGIRPGEGVLAVATTVDETRHALESVAKARQDGGIERELAARVTECHWRGTGHPVWMHLAAHVARSATTTPPASTRTPRLNVLYLYDDQWTHIETLREYLDSFREYSRHVVAYSSGILASAPSMDLDPFDVVMIHYSVRISLEAYISSSFVEALKGFGGLKVLFIQDEYEGTEQARQWMRTLGIHRVYTCVPDEYRNIVYPEARFPRVEFRQVLTGYVSPRYEEAHEFRPMAGRAVRIGYRGRALPYWYGTLGQEKMLIGKRMREICDARGIPVDIEWDDNHRIYGKAWLEFHENCRAVLGSESGANVFDYHGDLRRDITQAMTENPDLTFDEAYARFLDGKEGEVIMAQISPRVFEAISLGAALILFEGGYSGLLEPGIHYMSLKKDFSNVDEILASLEDIPFLEAMTRRAYLDIVASGRYSYRRFVSDIDSDLEQDLRRGTGLRLVEMVVGRREADGAVRVSHEGCLPGHPTTLPLSRKLDSYPTVRAGLTC